MSLTGPEPGRPAPASACRSATCWPACTARTASSPPCTSATRTGRGRVVRTSLLAAIVGVHAFQGTRYTVAGEVPDAQGNHHPSISPYGLFRCPDGMLQIAVGSEGLWQQFASAFGLDPRRAGLRHQRRAGRQPRRRHRRRRRRLRRPSAGRAAAASWPGRRPRRRGPHARPGLRVGADPLPGPGHRRRPPGARPDRAARPAAALRRQRARRRTHRAPAPAGARCSTTPRCAPGSTRWTPAPARAGREQPAGSAPGSCSTRCSTRAAGSRWDAPPLPVAEPGSAYAAELEAAADKRPALDESVITGEGTLQGRRVAVVAGEFGFLAGSIGVAAAERLVLAVERATREGLPLFAAPTSGGTRMQEGTRRLPADGQDLRRRRGAQGGRACPTSSTCATPRPAASSPPGARSATSPWPSRARWSASSGRGSTRRCTATPFPPGVQTVGEPLRARPARRGAAARGAGRGGRPGPQRADGAARGAAGRPRAAPREPAGPARLGVDHPLPAARAAGRAGPAQARRLRRRAAARHRRRASRTPGC